MTVSDVLLLLAGITVLAVWAGFAWDILAKRRHERQLEKAGVLGLVEEATTLVQKVRYDLEHEPTD